MADARLPKEFEKYLIPSETVVFSHRYHWFYLVKPFSILFGWLLVIGVVDRVLGLDEAGNALRTVAIWIWFGILLWTAFKLFEWYKEVFVATDRRLVLVYGILVRKVAMMPMSKVTDMRYDRSILGQILGFGTFILESAGQDQALNVIDYVSQPDRRYQQISAVLFGGDATSPRLAGAKTERGLPITEPNTLWWRR